MLDELLTRLKAMPADQQAAFSAEVIKGTKHMVAAPLPGPQTQAYLSKADVLLYGGKPGGGKTALEILLGLNEHWRTLVVRKAFVDLEGVLHTLDNIVGQAGSAIGGNRPRYETKDGRVIHFQGMGDQLDGKQGNPHDLICCDEAAQLPEDQVRMLMGWLRTDRPGQRCRVVLASNPPLDTVGDWLVEYFAPWLDDRHPNPAEPGELRWFLPNDSGSGYRECEEHDTMVLHDLTIKAQSRTFIPADYKDNPYYDAEAYTKTLAGLPDWARKRLMTGSFMDARADDQWQAIPTEWVREAQARWTPTPPPGVPLCAMGVDVAQGGTDRTVIARRHDAWFAPLLEKPGIETPSGADVAGLVIKHRRDNALVIIDIGGGWGGDAYANLSGNQIEVKSFMGVKATTRRTVDNLLTFTNVRTEAYWRMREALDPNQVGGSTIALPPSKRLLSDLCTPTYKVAKNGITLESKEDVVKRLGRSPDEGDAVVMCWWSGAKIASDWHNWPAAHGGRKPPPAVHNSGGRVPLTARGRR